MYEYLKWFCREEFSAPDLMDPTLLMKLDLARELAGVPFRITSSYRNNDPGQHGKGKAVDISCLESGSRILIVISLYRAGFRSIIVYPRHVHADVRRRPIGLMLGEYDAKEEDES